MKRNSLFVCGVLMFLLISCKKEHTCDCITTHVDNASGAITKEIKSTSKVYSEKMTEKQAKAACNHEAEAVNSSYENYWSNNGAVVDPSFSTSTNCQLK